MKWLVVSSPSVYAHVFTHASLQQATHTNINHDPRSVDGGKGAVVHQRLNVPGGGAGERCQLHHSLIIDTLHILLIRELNPITGFNYVVLT